MRRFTAGKRLRDHEADPMLRSVVEGQFETIGEALRQAVRLDSHPGDRITESRRIIAFRNRLIHGYASVANDVVWGVLEANLPTLDREVGALRREGEDPHGTAGTAEPRPSS